MLTGKSKIRHTDHHVCFQNLKILVTSTMCLFLPVGANQMRIFMPLGRVYVKPSLKGSARTRQIHVVPEYIIDKCLKGVENKEP